MMNRSQYGPAALGASAMLPVGCTAPGGDGGDGSDEPYKFAIVYGVSGFLAGYAPTYFSGVDAAVEYFNALTELLDSGYELDAVSPGALNNEVLALLPMLTDAGIFGAVTRRA